jgi:hypothetical protein
MSEERAYRVHAGSRDDCRKTFVVEIGVVEKARIGQK